MNVCIPTIGSLLRLTGAWTFQLHPEGRNKTLYKRLGVELDPYHQGNNPEHPTEVTLPKGTVLCVDRIYIRQQAGAFDSVSFYIEKCSDKTFAPKGKARVRFWAKLEDVNQTKATVDPDTTPGVKGKAFTTRGRTDMRYGEVKSYKVGDHVQINGMMSRHGLARVIDEDKENDDYVVVLSDRTIFWSPACDMKPTTEEKFRKNVTRFNRKREALRRTAKHNTKVLADIISRPITRVRATAIIQQNDLRWDSAEYYRVAYFAREYCEPLSLVTSAVSSGAISRDEVLGWLKAEGQAPDKWSEQNLAQAASMWEARKLWEQQGKCRNQGCIMTERKDQIHTALETLGFVPGAYRIIKVVCSPTSVSYVSEEGFDMVENPPSDTSYPGVIVVEDHKGLDEPSAHVLEHNPEPNRVYQAHILLDTGGVIPILVSDLRFDFHPEHAFDPDPNKVIGPDIRRVTQVPDGPLN